MDGRADLAAYLQHIVAGLRKPVWRLADVRDLGGVDLLHPDDRRAVPAARDDAGYRAPVSRVRLPDCAGALYRRRGCRPARALHLPDSHDLARTRDHPRGRSVLSVLDAHALGAKSQRTASAATPLLIVYTQRASLGL